jgi:hypothetical protein
VTTEPSVFFVGGTQDNVALPAVAKLVGEVVGVEDASFAFPHAESSTATASMREKFLLQFHIDSPDK